jgi:acetyltransferase-like isoleucine patch superfamily enzyme
MQYSYGIENIRVRDWGEGADVKIGAFCSIADNVEIFIGGNHRTDWVTTYPFGHVHEDTFPWHGEGHPATKGDVVIGNDVWIGSGVTILSGVNIGDGAVVSAKSVVVKDVPPYAIVGGNPAKVIKYRFSQDQIERLLKNPWWELSDSRINELIPLLCSNNIEALIAAKDA